MAAAGTLEYLISVNSSAVQSGLSKAESKVKGFGNKLSAWTVAKGQLIGRLVERAGASTLNFVKESVMESREFGASMSQVAATLGKSVDQMNADVHTTSVKFGDEVKTFTGNMTDFARFMGQNTAFTATQAADALNYMALAGYDTEKSMRMLPTVLNLAAAGNMDLARASDMVTDAQSALGLSIGDTERLVDQMAKTSSKTNTSVEQLGDAMLTVGGTAKMLGSGAIDTTTELSMALGVLADNGIKGSEGGTALRNVLLSLTAPTDKAAKQLENLGVDVFDAEGNMKDLPFILQDINEATKDMTQEQRTDFLSNVFNKRDLKAIEALLGTDMSRWEQLFTDVGNAEGSAAKMAKTQLNNLEGDITYFKSAVGEARLAIADKLTPTLRKFTQNGTKWVTKLTEAFKEGGFAGALKRAGGLIRNLITDSLGLGEDAKWSEIGKAVSQRVRSGITNAFSKTKIKIASFFGVDDAENATWGQIASAASKRIKEGFAEAKIKIADILGVEEPENATWSDISGKIAVRIKGGFADTKIMVADMLGIEEPENATWGDVASNIVDRIKANFTETKIKIADMLGVEEPENATWGDIAGNIVSRIKGKFENSKIKIADMLGVEEPENATWGEIAGNITDRIKGKLGEAKLKIADILGVEEPENATWGEIAGNIAKRIKGQIGDAKLKIADLLGIEDAGDATWSDIGQNIKTRLQLGLKDLKLKAADLLGIENADDASWSDIAMNIVNGLSKHISKKGSFLKQLILGDEYTDKSTWLDVGEKLSGYLSEAFSEGGILNAILGNAADIAAAAAVFAGDLFAGFGEWVNANSDQIVKIISNLADALGKASGPIISALTKIISSPDLWKSIINGLANIGEALLDSLLGKDLTNAIRRFFGVEIPGEVSNQSADTIRAAWLGAMDSVLDDPASEGKIAGQWNDFMTGIFNKSKLDPSMYNEFMNVFDFNSMFDAFKTMNLSDFYAALNNSINSISDGSGKIKALKKTADETAGEYDITFNIKTNGEMPKAFAPPPKLPGHAKGEWSVPYDNYLARLHRNEMVLTSSQARQYREGNSGMDSSAIVGAIQSLRNDMANLKLVVGRKPFGRAVVSYGGSGMSDYIGGSESRLAAGYGT